MNIKLIIPVLFIGLTQILTACAGSLIPSTPTPAVAATPTHDPRESAKVVQAFWKAMEKGDLDAAMAYVDAEVTCSGACQFTGIDAFRNYFAEYLQSGYTTKISELKSVGSIVTYTWEWYEDGAFVRKGTDGEMMQVDDGKIVYWANYRR